MRSYASYPGAYVTADAQAPVRFQVKAVAGLLTDSVELLSQAWWLQRELLSSLEQE